VHAADAYSRLNPTKLGCAVLTAGPGVTDGVTGIANAWRANSPILVIGGQGPFSNLRRGSLQEMGHVSMVRPISKWADACYDTSRIPEYIELAIRHAVSGIPGPSFLEIPMDIFMGSVDEEVVMVIGSTGSMFIGRAVPVTAGCAKAMDSTPTPPTIHSILVSRSTGCASSRRTTRHLTPESRA